jgi:large subunit ribosomal protein L24
MKSKFNKNWNKSVQPRKQVKFRANAPNHILRKFMTSVLDKSLRKKYERKNIEVRKNDEVKVMRGKFKGKQGKISICDIKNTRVQIEGITKQKKAGDKIGIWFHPSKIKITTLNEEDNKRLKRKEIKNNKKDNKEETKDAHKKE